MGLAGPWLAIQKHRSALVPLCRSFDGFEAGLERLAPNFGNVAFLAVPGVADNPVREWISQSRPAR